MTYTYIPSKPPKFLFTLYTCISRILGQQTKGFGVFFTKWEERKAKEERNYNLPL